MESYRKEYIFPLFLRLLLSFGKSNFFPTASDMDTFSLPQIDTLFLTIFQDFTLDFNLGYFLSDVFSFKLHNSEASLTLFPILKLGSKIPCPEAFLHLSTGSWGNKDELI